MEAGGQQKSAIEQEWDESSLNSPQVKRVESPELMRMKVKSEEK